MNNYEITYIISSKAPEEARDQLNADLEKHVSEMEGKIEHASAALRRQLAYPIQDEQAGFLRTLHVQLPPAEIKALRDWLKKHEHVLRTYVLQTSYREELGADVLKNLEEEAKKPVKKDEEEEKEVTMEDVEKGIEDALSEEVK